jgi:branched-chain amino acid transport system ATP-binding protein
MLKVEGLHTYYGRAHILADVGFEVAQGNVVVLLGRNGAGKSTTLKSIMGLVPPAQGRIAFAGTEIAGKQPFEIARLGLGYVPEDRRVFTELTVDENLAVGRRRRAPARRSGRATSCLPCFPTSHACAIVLQRGCRAASSRCSPLRAP